MALKESIAVRERELREHFDKQGEALNTALDDAYTQRKEAREKEKNRLNAKRLLEDTTMRNQVFRAFEQEASSEAITDHHTPPISEPSSLDISYDTSLRSTISSFMWLKERISKKVNHSFIQCLVKEA